MSAATETHSVAKRTHKLSYKCSHKVQEIKSWVLPQGHRNWVMSAATRNQKLSHECSHKEPEIESWLLPQGPDSRLCVLWVHSHIQTWVQPHGNRQLATSSEAGAGGGRAGGRRSQCQTVGTDPPASTALTGVEAGAGLSMEEWKVQSGRRQEAGAGLSMKECNV